MFLLGKQIFFCLINMHLKVDPYSGVLRATFALSGVSSDAGYTVISPFGGESFVQNTPLYLCLSPPQLEKCHQSRKIFAKYCVRLL